MARRTWAEIKQQRGDDPEIRAGHERARRAFELGEQVRALREQRGLTQQELARRAGTSQPAIARLEAGGVDARIDTLQRVGRALDADLLVRFQPREPAAVAR